MVMDTPPGFGYSLLAGVSPIYGLYTSLFPMIMYAIFGSSRHASIEFAIPRSLMRANTCIKDCSTENSNCPAGFYRFRLLPAGRGLLFGFLRLGNLSVFLSEQLVSGFTAGVSVHIGSSQLPGLFGIDVTVYSGPFLLIKSNVEFFHRIAQTHLPTLALSVTSFTFMLLIKIFVDPLLLKKLGIPVPIEMVVLLTHLAAPALAVSVVSYAITISLGRIFSRKHKYNIDPNQWRAPFLFQAILCTVIFISLKKVFLQVRDFQRFWRVSRIDGNIWMVSFLATVLVDVQFGLIIGILFSLLTLIYQIKRPKACLLGSIPNTDFYVPVKDYGVVGICMTLQYNFTRVSRRIEVQKIAYKPKHDMANIPPSIFFFFLQAAEIPGVKVFHFGGPIHFANSDYFRSEVYRKLKIDARSAPEKPTWMTLRLKSTANNTKAKRNVIKIREPSCSFTAGGAIAQFETRPSDAVYMTTEPVAALGRPAYIIFDFSRVSFVDGTSIGTMTEIFQEYRNLGINIHIAACSGSPHNDSAKRPNVKEHPSSDKNSHVILTYGTDGVGSSHPNTKLGCSVNDTRGS
ncbi:hypothetical protein HPB48_019638 [Haemaphysalis longicornis]|uniref:STAS domain-containing protein n=1 Tax=Haemaphysalis longicornis TaxID=44386 RepID=A0A9J6GZE5_HAELO|nr:hypothetical protein HPB48_019638 [Haemaphysalis longicornis]